MRAEILKFKDDDAAVSGMNEAGSRVYVEAFTRPGTPPLELCAYMERKLDKFECAAKRKLAWV